MKNNLNLPPFYVGQKVVCVEPAFGIKKGDFVYVKALRMMPCGCWNVSAGIVDTNPIPTECDTHHGSFISFDGIRWIHHECFAPIQEQKFPLIKLSKVIEKEKELISAN